MRIASLPLLLLLAALGANGAARADGHRGPREGRHSEMREEMRSMHRDGDMQKSFSLPGARHAGDAREAPPRMDPEDRRRLRRDIDEAGRELYRRRHP